MERLTFTDEEMERTGTDCPVKNDYIVDRFCDNVCDEFQHNCPFMKMAQKLKSYEDKQEQGLLIELPCKVGDTVYWIGTMEVTPASVQAIYCKADGWYLKINGFHCTFDAIGKRFFLARSEAEEALARMKGE